MSKITESFHNKAFISYLMAGDPDLATSAEYILAAQEAGADLIEIGIPFSDPIAEGSVIQAASQRALQAGTRLDTLFGMVASLKDRIHVPLLFMTYLNPVYAYGYTRFFSRCADIGVSGIIIPDLPYEEQAEVKEPAAEHGIDLITLVAPTSTERAAKIARDAQGFIYLVSSLGVTGMRRQIDTDLSAIIEDIRRVSAVPIAVGFGISTPEQAAGFAAMADGVIVGSALVDIIGQYGKNAKEALKNFIAQMKAAI